MSQLKDNATDEDYESDDYFEPELDDEEDTSTPTMFEGPRFTRPTDLSRTVERRVNESGLKLSCSASGNPAPRVSWYKNGSPLNRTGTHEGRWAIVLDHLVTEDTGIYKCEVCNSVSCIENEFNVVISQQEAQEVAAHFTKKMDYTSKIYRPMGNMVKVKCPAAGNPEPNITWTKNNMTIERKMGQQVSYGKWGIILEDIIMDDTGNYTCRICNTGGCQQFTYEVFVQGKSQSFPKPENLVAIKAEDEESDLIEGNLISNSMESEKGENATNEIQRAPYFLKPGSMNILEKRPSGSTYTFKCPYGGHPAANITWTKDDEEIVRKLGHFRKGKWSITLEELISTDSGRYKCLICNDLGCIKHVFKFEVIDRHRSPPYIKDGYPKNRTVLVNSTVDLECPTLSDLGAYTYWLKGLVVNNSFPSEINRLEVRLKALRDIWGWLRSLLDLGASIEGVYWGFILLFLGPPSVCLR